MNDEFLRASKDEVKKVAQQIADVLIQDTQDITPVVIDLSEIVDLEQLVSSEAGIYDPLGQLRKFFTDTLNSVASWVSNAVSSTVKGFIDWLWNSINSALEGLKDFIKPIFDMLKDIKESFNKIVIKPLTDLVKQASDFLASLPERISNIQSLLNGIVSGVSKSITSIVSKVGNIINGIIEGARKLFNAFAKQVQEGINNVLKGLENINEWFKGLASLYEKIRKGIEDFINKLANLPREIPEIAKNLATWFWSSVVKPTYDFIVQNIINPLVKGIDSIVSKVSKGFEAISKTFMGFVNTLARVPELLWQLVPDWLKKAIEGIRDFFENVWKSLQDFLKDPIKHIKDAFSWLAEQVWKLLPDWLKNVLMGIQDFFNNLWKGLQDFFKDPLGWFNKNVIEPLKNGFTWLAKEIWKHLPEPIRIAIDTIRKVFEHFIERMKKEIQKFIENPFGWLTEKARYVGHVFEEWGKYLQSVIWSIHKHLPEPYQRTFKKCEEITSKGIDYLYDYYCNKEKFFRQDVMEYGVSTLPIPIIIFPSIYDMIVMTYHSFVNLVKPFIQVAEKPTKTFYKLLIERIANSYASTVGGKLEKVVRSATGVKLDIKRRLESIKEIDGGKIIYNTLTSILPSVVVIRSIPELIRATAYLLDEVAKDLSSFILRILGISVGKGGASSGHSYFSVLVALANVLDEAVWGIFRWASWGITYWVFEPLNEPLRMLIRYIYRDVVPFRIPTIAEITRMVQRHLGTQDKEVIYGQIALMKELLALHGYPSYIVDMYARIIPEEIRKVTKYDAVIVYDRFNQPRRLPIPLVYDLPSASEICRMMIKDIFRDFNEFTKAIAMRGYLPDEAYMYYLLHFRYPSPTTLWEFVCRGVSGLLWFEPSESARKEAENEAKAINAYVPLPPTTFSDMTKESISKLFDALSTYMKWHDYARFSYIENFTSDNWIVIDTLADIPTKIDIRWMCVPPDTIILGDNKPICEYKVGDYALYGGKVLETFVRPYKGEMIKIVAHNILPVIVTPEHPILIVEGEVYAKRFKENGKVKCRRVFRYSKPYFIEAYKVKPSPRATVDGKPARKHSGHFLVMPRIKGDVDIRELDLRKYTRRKDNARKLKIPLNTETAWILGLYVAEGCVVHSDKDLRIQITLGWKEVEKVEKVVKIFKKLGYSPWIINSGSAYQINISSPILARAFGDWCGDNCYNKQIPEFIMRHKDPEIVKAFLRGYLEGDGYWDGKKNRWDAVTTSKVLAMQLQLLLARLGIPSSIHVWPKRERNGMKQSETYRISFALESKYIFKPRRIKGRLVRIFKDYLLIPIKKVEYIKYDGLVYNLETERNVYLVSGVVVHNCRWGIFEKMKEKVGLKTPVSEFVKVLDDRPLNEKVTMDLTLMCRLLQATGLHPYYVPIVAVAESINALTDERTLLRTGLLNLYRDAIMPFDELDKLMKSLTTVSFKVTYLDMKKKEWSEAKWFNMPVMFLPAERKLLSLRALIDRYDRVLRDVIRDCERAYREYILGTDEILAKLNEITNELNKSFTKHVEEISGAKFSLVIDEEFIKARLKAQEIERKIYTTRRARYWFTRILGWLIYRLAYAYVTSTDIDNVLSVAKSVAKFSDVEIRALKSVMEQVSEIARREYIPTPSQLATISEIVPEARRLFTEVVKARRVPTKWIPIWQKYVALRPVIDDVRRLLSSSRRLYEYFIIEEDNFKKILESLKPFGYEDTEINIIIKSANLDRYYRAWRELVGTPRELVTLAEYSPRARQLAVAQVHKMIDALPVDDRTKAFLKTMWEEYIRIRPVYDEVRRYVTELLSDYADGVIDRATLESELNELKKWGLDDYEIQFYLWLAEKRRLRREYRRAIGGI